MSTAPSLSKPVKLTVWTLQILVGLMFIAAGAMKWAGAQFAVDIFEHIGIGQWFRYVTGTVELVSGVLLLLPVTAPFAGIILAITMVCAIFTHLAVIGGSPVPAIVLLVGSLAIVWLRRRQLPIVGAAAAAAR